MTRWFLLLVVLSFVELYVLTWLGAAIGALPTIGLLLVSATAGVMLTKSEGLRVLRSWHAAVTEGRAPEEGLTDGLLVLLGGVLLILPGVVSDLFGVALLVPAIRRFVAGQVRGAFERKVRDGSFQVMTLDMGGMGEPMHDGPRSVESRRYGEVIDVEGQVVEEATTRPDRLLGP